MNGLLACELIATTAKITMKKAHSLSRDESEYILSLVEDRRPVLAALVQSDRDVFSEVIAAQSAAKKANTPQEKRKHQVKGRQKLKEATDLVLRIAREASAWGD